MTLGAKIAAVILTSAFFGGSLALWMLFADEVTLAYLSDLAMRCF